MDATSNGRRAIIVGGGIGGVTAGYALNSLGIRADVYEQASDLHKIYVGSGIHLWNNAMRALKEIGLADAVEHSAGREAVVERMQIKSHKGKVLGDVPMGDIGRKIGADCIGINRAELLPLLGEQLDEGVLHLDSKVVDFAQDESGVTAYFEDGREERGDFLVGADGLHSFVRAKLLGGEKPRFAGYTIWQGITSFEDADHAPIGLFLICYGPGLRFAFYRVGGARLYWFAVENADEGGKDPEGKTKSMMLQRFEGWPQPIREIIEGTDEASIHRRDLYDRDPVTRWGEGRITLLGDAAHAMTFDVGQGAGQSIEDALVLSRYVSRSDDVVGALREYEARRQPRTKHMQKISRFVGVQGKWDSRGGMLLRNVLTKMMFGNRIAFKKFQEDLTYEF